MGVPTLPRTIGPTWADFGRRERQRDRDVGEFAQRPSLGPAQPSQYQPAVGKRRPPLQQGSMLPKQPLTEFRNGSGHI